tara:strand:- start:7294 stop:7770 length:477 start_codon:yes stop_codon:yes gene_type:complete
MMTVNFPHNELSQSRINHLQLLHKFKPEEIPKQEEIEKIKFQNIKYYKDNGVDPSIDPHNAVLIDFFKAKNEIKKVDWNYKTNFIGFSNDDTFEILQMVRLEENKWYVENLIGSGSKWEGYVWFCQINTSEVLRLVGLFFEESQWFRSQNWTLKRIKT